MFVADASHAASDVLGEASAALSLMYLNYKDVDEDYSERCLKAAKELYNMGKSNPGLSSGQGYYTPISYKDDLAWAACWLYTATGDESYLNDAREYVIDQGSGLPRAEYWALCWDDVYIAAELRLLELTGDSIYNDALLEHINYMNNRCETTPGGLKYITSWGSLRYAAAIAMIAEAYYEDTADTSALNLAKSQIDYILGDNPENMSYIIGYGSRWPQHPHHRAANGYTYIDSGNLKPAKNLLLGALVGGPDSGDVFSDDGAQYQYTEVGIDYNAALVGALAGLTKVYGSGTAVRNSVIAASSFTFDKDSPQDIVIPTEFNGNELDNIVNGATPLVKGSDYTVSDNAITIKQSYLASQSADTVKLMLLFSGGNVPYVTITMGSGGSSGGDSGGGSGGSGGTPTAPGSLEVQMYIGNTSAATNGIMPRFKLTNNGSDPIDLSSITLRYYFTENGTQNQNFWCDWSSAGTSYVTGKFVKLANAVTGADTYLEIGFTSGAGSLAPGASVEVQVRFSKADWTNYDQSDDYSFNSNANYYVDWSKVTAYQNGSLIWGAEP